MRKLLQALKPYQKVIAQVITTMLVAFITVRADDTPITASETFNILAVGFGALAVFTTGDTAVGVLKYCKNYVAAASAVVVIASSAVSDGSWTNAEILQAVLAGLGALGVSIVPGPKVEPIPQALTGVIRGRHEA